MKGEREGVAQRACWHADVNASKSCVHMWGRRGEWETGERVRS